MYKSHASFAFEVISKLHLYVKMMLRETSLCLLFFFGCAFARTISRYGDAGNVNLVEFNIKGVIYGRCVYSEEGEEYTVIYEERGNELAAKTMNPTIIDPVARARRCREAAVQPPSPRLDGRQNDANLDPVEIQRQLYNQFTDFEEKMQGNYEYVSQLQPRFIIALKKAIALKLGLSALAGGGNQHHISAPQGQNVGLSVNRLDTSSLGGFLPGINLLQPAQQATHSTIGLPSKFGTLHSTGGGAQPHQHGTIGGIVGGLPAQTGNFW